MKNIIYPFPCPIYQDFLDESSFLEIQKNSFEYIEKNKEKFQYGWNSSTLTTFHFQKENKIDHFINDEVLKKEIKNHVSKYFNVWRFKTEKVNAEINDLWINIAQKGGYQEEHNHGSFIFSGVLYLQVTEESGYFQFVNPLESEAILMGYSDIFQELYTIFPKNGMIVLFPGWMRHKALPNRTDQDRISISFNVEIDFIS